MTSELDFEHLVRTHQRMVFSIAYHYLRDGASAEEVAQDVFLELHKRLGSLESRDHAMFWLRRVACHRAIDYARRRPSAERVSLDDAPEPSQPAALGDPMLSRRLHESIASLPEKMRMVIILRYQEEAKLEEIADVLDIPINTVKSQLHRALAMLKEKMERTIGKAIP